MYARAIHNVLTQNTCSNRAYCNPSGRYGFIMHILIVA